MSYQQAASIKPKKISNVHAIARDDSKTITPRVDINELLCKIKEKEKVQRKENLILFSLVTSVIVIIGIIASL